MLTNHLSDRSAQGSGLTTTHTDTITYSQDAHSLTEYNCI